MSLGLDMVVSIARAIAEPGGWPGAAGARFGLGSLAGSFGVQSRPSFWMPAGASSGAHAVDWLFYFILAISTFFFLLIVFLATFFVVRYRRRPGVEAVRTATHNTPLELTWSVIPLILVVVIFVLGFRGYLDLNTSPQNALPIIVTAQKWSWAFTYPNGYTDAMLHVPVDTPVELTLTSEDVIHSLFIPNFRVKRDVVPGRYAKEWFRATVVGEYPIYCAEYCGTSHSDMLSTVVVHEPGGYEKWLQGAFELADQMAPAEAGARIYKTRGCGTCHSTDGKAGIGPTLRGVYGSTVVLADRSSVTADEDYIRQSILEPSAQVAAGFDPVMPTFKGRMKDKEITAIIEYLKTLK